MNKLEMLPETKQILEEACNHARTDKKENLKGILIRKYLEEDEKRLHVHIVYHSIFKKRSVDGIFHRFAVNPLGF